MGNADTIKSLTDNMQTVLQAQGIKFARKNLENIKDIPSSLLPYGAILDKGIEFEYTHGQRAGYAEQNFLIWVVDRERNDKVNMRQIQEWLQKIRGALTVNALNIGDLVTSKLVSRVTTVDTDTEHREDGLSVLNYLVSVRYREL